MPCCNRLFLDPLKGTHTEPKLQQMKCRSAAALRQSSTFDTRTGPKAFIWKFHKRFWAFTLDRAVSACFTSSVSQSVMNLGGGKKGTAWGRSFSYCSVAADYQQGLASVKKVMLTWRHLPWDMQDACHVQE